MPLTPCLHHAARSCAVLTLAATAAFAQQPQGPPANQGPQRPSGPMQEAARLDLDGKTAEARAIFQRMIDSAADPARKAAAQRSMAISYAFDGDCANTVKYEELVIGYWQTREQAEPQNAFYQEGEMADEAARVCIDAGDLGAAERWYRRGYELGMREPTPRTHPASLWDFRLAHALARIAARHGDSAEAYRQTAAARRALDGDSAMAAQQERFFPYLRGYVALYLNRLDNAEPELNAAVQASQRDPFMRCLLGMLYERQGKQDLASATYRQAYDLAAAHNPPAAFVRPFVRKKLNLPASP